MPQSFNRYRERVAAGSAVTGVIVFSGSPLVVEVIAAAGVDFVILDMEHSPLSVSEAAHLIRAADASGITAFVRVPQVDPPLITRILDLGAAGIVLPHANAESCRALVSAMRYPPEGERGACQITRAGGYRRGDWEAHAARATRELTAVALIEDAATLQDIDAVASVPGLDVCFVGPTDLSVALGVPGSTFDDPELGAALDRVVAAAKRHGKSAMTLLGRPLDTGYGKRLADRGVQMIVLGTDADLLIHSLSGLSAIRD